MKNPMGEVESALKAKGPNRGKIDIGSNNRFLEGIMDASFG